MERSKSVVESTELGEVSRRVVRRLRRPELRGLLLEPLEPLGVEGRACLRKLILLRRLQLGVQTRLGHECDRRTVRVGEEIVAKQVYEDLAARFGDLGLELSEGVLEA